MGKRLEKILHREAIKMASKHIKRYLTSLAVKVNHSEIPPSLLEWLK